VLRVRFQRHETFNAESDFWVCRCNSGVMQFTARESLRIDRVKNKLLGVKYTPEDIDFKIRLHNEELIPDNHAHCFRDFTMWLNRKTPFSQRPCWNTPATVKIPRALQARTNCIQAQQEGAFKQLDELALPAGPKAAEKTYETVKQMWFDICLKEKKPPAPPPNTHPGTTDSSIDFYHMKNIGDVSLDPKNWVKYSKAVKARLAQHTKQAGADKKAVEDKGKSFKAACCQAQGEGSQERPEKA